MIVFPNNARGIYPILIAVGIVSVLGLGSLMSQVVALRASKQKLKVIDRVEGFYACEMAAWHSALRSDLPPVAAQPIALFPATPPDETPTQPYSTVPGTALDLNHTQRVAPFSSWVRRYTFGNLLQSSGSTDSCGHFRPSSRSAGLKVCLFRKTAPTAKGFLLTWSLNLSSKVYGYLGDGTPDPSFGNAGILTKTWTDDPAPGEMSMLPGGRFFMAESGNNQQRLSLHEPNGTLVTAFGVAGKVVQDWMGRRGDMVPREIVQLRDGGFVISNHDTFNFKLSKITSNGSVATSFADAGTATIFLAPLVYGASEYVAELSDGKILVWGFGPVPKPGGGGNTVIFAARFLENGQVDASFGNQGRLIFDPSGSLPFSRHHRVCAPLDSTQHFSCYAFEPSTGKFFRYRFTANGTLDPAFTNGLETRIQYPNAFSHSFGVDRSQRVWSWHQEPDLSMTVRRWQTDGPQDTTFGSNGVVTVPPPDKDIGIPMSSFVLGLTPSGVLYIQEYTQAHTPSSVLLRVGPDGWDESFGTRGRLHIGSEYSLGVGLLAERP